MRDTGGRHDSRRPGLLRYVLGWLAGGAAVVAAVAVLGGARHPAARTVEVPPVREIHLTAAAASAGCLLTARRLPARSARRPPGVGPGVYDRPLAAGERDVALAHGLILVEYGRRVGGEALATLRDLQAAVPTGTILAPGAVGAADLTVWSLGRELRCPRLEADALDALRLFRGRYLGTTAARPGVGAP